jgi:polysaccharide pyruvyl transferase WcaK-like protein
MTGPPVKVVLYGYFGMGNIGNEASFAAVAAALRRCGPGVSLHALVADPAEVARLHGVPARRLMAYRAVPGAGGTAQVLRKVLGRVVDVPRTLRLLRDVDVLVVPGTGVLETQLMARPWGLPYWLLLATAACRARGGQVALVSVGAEPAAHPVTRLLFRSIVRLATCVSVRDDASADVVRSWGRTVPVTPDLAFALPVPDCPEARPGHVVIGVMAYEGDPADPQRGPHVVAAYGERMAEVVARLADDGRSVVLVAGDLQDLGLAEDVLHRAAARSTKVPGSVRVSRASTLEDLMVELAQAEVTVVSRFHNLIAALKVARPTVSLSYAGKSDRLLEEFGLGSYAQPIESFDVDLLLEQLDRCRDEAPRLEVTAKEVLQRYEADLARQHRHLVEVLAPGQSSGAPPAGRQRPGAPRPARR